MPEISIPGHETLNLIGEGGMAQVYAGARLGAGKSIKPVAIKVIRPELSTDHRYQEMFLSEGRTAMMFAHGNIVTVFDVGVVDGQLYMVMDWVDGVTVSHFARTIIKKRGRPLELPVALAIVVQLLCGLDYAHNYKLDRKKVGIVHRDVSPHNVMISSSGEVKLLDFGVARIAGGRTTRSLKGNLSYMAREQAQGNPRVESDLYAVGALLFELLAGERFRSHCKTEDELLHDIFEGGVPELRRADVPEELRRLLRELLAVSWHDRPHSAVEVIKRIANLPVEQLSSNIPIKELYWAFFGESHSGLTRFAHRDPQMWVDHMRKLGKGKGGHRVVSKKTGFDEPVPEGSTEAVPRRLMQPRAHEGVSLHPAGDADADPFEASKTVRLDPERMRRPADARKAVVGEAPAPSDAAAAAAATSSAAIVEPTVRLAWPGAAERDGRGSPEGRSEAPPPDPTVRLTGSPFTRLDPAGVAWVRQGSFTRFGSVVRMLRGGAEGPVRWRDVLTGPAGLIVLAVLTFGVVLPITCHVTMRDSEVRR